MPRLVPALLLFLLAPGCAFPSDDAHEPRWVLVASAFGSPAGTLVDLGLLDAAQPGPAAEQRLQPFARATNVTLVLRDGDGNARDASPGGDVLPEASGAFATLRVEGSAWRNLTAGASFVLPDGSVVTPDQSQADASPAWRVTASVHADPARTSVLAEVFERRNGTRGYSYSATGAGNVDKLAPAARDVLHWAAEGTLPNGSRARAEAWTFSGTNLVVALPAGASNVTLDFALRLADGRVVRDEDADVTLRVAPPPTMPGP